MGEKMSKIDNEKDHLAILSICSGERDVFDGEYDFRKKWLNESLIGKNMPLIGEKIYISERIQERFFITGYTTLLEVLNGEDVDDILNRTGNPKGSSERAIKDYFDRNARRDTNDLHSPQGFYALHFDEITAFKQSLPLFELSKISPNFVLSHNVTYVGEDNIVYWILTEWERRLSNECDDPIREAHKILAEARRRK